MKKIYAFSLIELVVVIVTLALFAGLLLPAMSSAREEARKSSCKGCLKNMVLLCKMYAQDYDNVWPVEEKKGTKARQNFYLLFTSDVADNIELFFCASSDSDRQKHRGRGISPSDFEYTDYAYYDAEPSEYDDSKLHRRRRTAHGWRPESIVMMGDAWAGHSDPSDNKWTHDNGTNTAWSDGHVEWLEQQYVGIHGPHTNVK